MCYSINGDYMIDKITIYEAKTFKERLFGLMFKKNIDYCLLFKNCNSIHTFFMMQNIDVCMLDKEDKIVLLKENAKKNKIIYHRNAKTTLEMPLGATKYLKINNKLKIK